MPYTPKNARFSLFLSKLPAEKNASTIASDLKNFRPGTKIPHEGTPQEKEARN
jgi:hypothetical protein